MSKELTRDQLSARLDTLENKAIRLDRYANLDSNSMPHLREMERERNAAKEVIMAHDAAQRATIQQLEEKMRSLERDCDTYIAERQQYRATIQQQADKIAELESTMTCMYEGHRVQLQDADTQIFTAQQRIQQLEAQLAQWEEFKQRDVYQALVDARAKVQQLEARIVQLETDVDMMAWKTSPAMAQATIDQLVTRNDQLEARVKEVEALYADSCSALNAHMDIHAQVVNLVKEVEEEVTRWRTNGVTEELLRRHNGSIKVGKGCRIALDDLDTADPSG